MRKILISLPNQLAVRMRSAIPEKQRSRVIASLIEKEVSFREQQLRECAIALESDLTLREEMAEWNITLQDGIDDEKR